MVWNFLGYLCLYAGIAVILTGIGKLLRQLFAHRSQGSQQSYESQAHLTPFDALKIEDLDDAVEYATHVIETGLENFN